MGLLGFEFRNSGEAAETTPERAPNIEGITIPSIPDKPAEPISTEGIVTREEDVEQITIGETLEFAQLYPDKWNMIVHQLAIHLTETFGRVARAKGYRTDMVDDVVETALTDVLKEAKLAEIVNRFLAGWQERMQRATELDFEETAARDIFGAMDHTEIAGKVLERMYKH
jgi:hypothetical protein